MPRVHRERMLLYVSVIIVGVPEPQNTETNVGRVLGIGEAARDLPAQGVRTH